MNSLMKTFDVAFLFMVIILQKVDSSIFDAVINLDSLVSSNGAEGYDISGESTNNYLGSSIHTAGDFNGDGKADFIVGAYGYPLESNTGVSLIIFGKPTGSYAGINITSLSSTDGITIKGESSGDSSGFSVSGGCDINNDGFSDVIIGAYTAGPSSVGKVYVIFGGSSVGNNGELLLNSLDGTNGFEITGESANDYFGHSVSCISDTNGDGFPEILIGAHGNNEGGSDAGAAYVFFGGPSVGSTGSLTASTLSGSNGFKMVGRRAGDYFGYSVASAGDVNNDGFHDIVIGAPYEDEYLAGLVLTKSNVGYVYVQYGGSTVGNTGTIDASNINGWAVYGGSAGQSFGSVVGVGCDIDGDDYDDVLVGDTSTFTLLNGGTTGLVGSILSLLLTTDNFEFHIGTAVTAISCVGDINDDGYPDIAVSSNTIPNTQDSSDTKTNAGAVFVIFGGPSIDSGGSLELSALNGAGGFQMYGASSDDGLGSAVGGRGDFNGDGYPDLLVGAASTSAGAGKAYVLFGRTTDPSLTPTIQPQTEPTADPTELPSYMPTNSPTEFATTVHPTIIPSISPSASQSESPTVTPTDNTAESPSFASTTTPTPAVAWSPLLGPNTLDSPMGFARIDGFLYATGFTRSFANGTRNENDFDAFVYKRLGTGDYERVWKVHLGGEGNDVGLGVTADRLFNVYVTGKTASAQPGCTHSGGSDVFVAKLNAEGQQQWLVQFGSSGDDEGRKVIVTEKEEEEVMTLTVYGTISGVAFKTELDSDGRFK